MEKSMFSERLKRAMDENGITAYGLAKKLGVTDPGVRNWMSGTREPKPLSQVAKIANELCVTTDFLLGTQDEEYPVFRDAAGVLGVSQSAIEKLRKYKEDCCKSGKNIALNALLMHPSFTVLLGEVLSLYYESQILQKNPLLGIRASGEIDHRQLSKKLAGAEYLKYHRNEIVDAFGRMLDTATGYQKAVEKSNSAITARMVGQIYSVKEKENGNE